MKTWLVCAVDEHGEQLQYGYEAESEAEVRRKALPYVNGESDRIVDVELLGDFDSKAAAIQQIANSLAVGERYQDEQVAGLKDAGPYAAGFRVGNAVGDSELLSGRNPAILRLKGA